MSSHDFVTANVLPGKTNALVKNLMEQMGIDDPNEAVRRVNAGEWIVEKRKQKLLEPILEPMATINLPSRDRFVAADNFRANRSDIKLCMSVNFQENFLGKVEKNVRATELFTHKLLRPSRDPGIIAELGEQEETTLYHLFTLLAKQAVGERGVLLTNGSVNMNIFYIRDNKGILWAVSVGRYSGYWSLDAFSVEDPLAWGAGRLVVSREYA